MRVHGVTQLFIKRAKNKNIKPIFANVSDDVFMTGVPDEIKCFAKYLQKRFEISKILIDYDIEIKGATVSRNEKENIRMSIRVPKIVDKNV